MSNLVFLTRASLQIFGQNSEEGISDFRIYGQSLIKRYCHNSRTSDDIDMKLERITKLDKRNKITSKNLKMTSRWKIVASLLFFRFTANLEQSGRRVPDALSVKRIFSLIVTFYLTKTKKRTIALCKGTILAKKRWFFAKNADIIEFKRALVLKGIFSEATCKGVYFSAKLQVSSVILTSFNIILTRGKITPPLPSLNEPLKSPSRSFVTFLRFYNCILPFFSFSLTGDPHTFVP